MKTDISIEVAFATPPITVVVFHWIAAIPLDKAIGIATLLYITLQSAYLLWKWRRDIKKESDGK